MNTDLDSKLEKQGGILGVERYYENKEELTDIDPHLRYLSLKHHAYELVILNLSTRIVASESSNDHEFIVEAEAPREKREDAIQWATIMGVPHSRGKFNPYSPDALFDELINYGPARELRSFTHRMALFIELPRYLFEQRPIEKAIDQVEACKTIFH